MGTQARGEAGVIIPQTMGSLGNTITIMIIRERTNWGIPIVLVVVGRTIIIVTRMARTITRTQMAPNITTMAKATHDSIRTDMTCLEKGAEPCKDEEMEMERRRRRKTEAERRGYGRKELETK